MSIRERIADVLHDFYIEASTRKMSREEFEQFIDRTIALFPGAAPSDDTVLSEDKASSADEGDGAADA